MAGGRQHLGRYYTPADVARRLIALVHTRPKNVIDLGCGQGSLSRAATARWGDAIGLVTVDLDPTAGPLGARWSSQHLHLNHDLLKGDLFDHHIDRRAFDLAVLNPPYGRAQNSTCVSSETLKEDFLGSIEKIQSIRCKSTIFMLLAIQAVRPGGTIVAILPDTLARGPASKACRQLITSYATIEEVIPLPARTFPGTEARTNMVLFRRVQSQSGYGKPWDAQPSEKMPNEVGGQSKLFTSLTELGVEVVRGHLSTTQARAAGAFHLHHFKEADGGLVRLPLTEFPEARRRGAGIGDILVARVGRNIPRKIVRVVAGSNLISDCIYRLRCDASVAERVWEGLTSDDGRQQMESSLAGVTTRFLPLNRLLELRV